MGYIASADTIYSKAYLTETGRAYLFNSNNNRYDSAGDDLFQVKKFTLSDIDTNYKTVHKLSSGQVPDISGKSENCLKATANYVQRNLVAFVFSNTPANVKYNTSLGGSSEILSISESAIATISAGEVAPALVNTNGSTTTTFTASPGSSTIVQ